MKEKISLLKLFVAMALLGFATLGGFLTTYAQSPSAAMISGTVKDPTGAVVSGAVITVENTDTGISHTAVTDGSGGYRVTGLEPGNYEITAERTGFKEKRVTGITITVNQQAVIDISLEVGEITEAITIRGQAPLLETTTAQVAYLVNKTVIRALPLNGRDFVSLSLLQPGVTSIAAISGTSQVTTGTTGNTNGGKFAVNGLPSKGITYLIDGSDVTDPFGLIPTLAGVTGAALGVEAVREFRIITTNYSAQYGRKGGGIIEAVTTGGTNELHGSAFEFIRNDALDARNFFDDPNRPIPEFKRNQFGFSLGGPIIKDRTFFFANYEGLRERLGITQSFVSPNAQARQGILPDPQNPGQLIRVDINPSIKPFLDLYPLPNGPDLGDGTGIVNTSATEPITEDFFVVRVDHELGKKDRLFARYWFDDGRFTDPFESTVVPGFPGNVDDRNQFFTISEQRLFTPSVLNEFQFSFNRQADLAAPASTTPGLNISLIPNQPLGLITVFGLPALGHNFILPIGQFNNIFQWTDTLSISRGRYLLKLGVDVKRIQNAGPFALGFLGQYQFSTLANFLQANPTIFLGTLPDNSDSDRGYRVTNWAFYEQFDLKLRPNLTLNLGLRYGFETDPTESNGRIANIINPLTDSAPTVGKLLNSPKNLFGPRVGLAWSLDKKTTVRAGFGIFYNFLSINEYSDTRFLPPFYELALSITPPFLDPLAGPIVIRPFGITIPNEFDFNMPTVYHFHLTVQREITPNTVIQASYVGTRGYHLLSSGNINTPIPQMLPDGRKFFDPAAPRINPAFGPILFIHNNAQSFYHSFQLSLQRRLSKGLQFQGSYTLSKSIDDASGPFLSDFVSGAGPVQDGYSAKGDRALSAWDVRQNFVFNFTYQLPVGPGQRFLSDTQGAVGKLLEGWGTTGIFTVQSGLRFTPVLGFNRSQDGSVFFADRPDLIGNPNVGKCPNGAPVRTPGCWFNPSAFRLQPAGTYGNAGRNVLIGPDFKNFDFAVLKETSINERVRVQFRTEFFNLTNHPNFGPPINSTGFNARGGNGEIIFNDPTGLPVASAGRIFRTVNTSRQIQFGLKILF